MPWHTSKIDSYVVNIHGKKDGNVIMKDSIFGYMRNERSAKLICYFYDKESDMPVNKYSAGLDRIILNFPAYKFERILDIFRNEDPIYCHYNDEPRFNKLGYVCTQKEAVGEEES